MKISVSSTFSPLSQNCLNGDQKRANSTDQSHEPRYLGHQAAYLRQCTYSHTPTAYRNQASTPHIVLQMYVETPLPEYPRRKKRSGPRDEQKQ